jgi:hypothetical protein
MVYHASSSSASYRHWHSFSQTDASRGVPRHNYATSIADEGKRGLDLEVKWWSLNAQ